MALLGTALRAAVTEAEFEAMKKEMHEMRMQINGMSASATPVVSQLDKALAAQCVSNETVKSSVGRLTMGGMLQVWYYAFERDNRGLFDNPGAGIVDHNQAVDISSFQIRRAELNMAMDIHENFTAYMMVDFARESDAFGGSFPQLAGSNQGFVKAGLDNKIGAPAGSVPRILQDAVINMHGIIPHHDITVGQFLPYFSSEDFNPNGWLDFVERSWIGNFYPRDIGACLHGSWWGDGGGGPYCGAGNSGRFQYWLTAFNGATTYLDAGTQNHSDDNNSKDFLATAMVHPLWDDCWGHLELGGSWGFGKHGNRDLNHAIEDINNNAANGPFLNGKFPSTGHRYSGWIDYKPGGGAKGLWVKGEYGHMKDRTENVNSTTGLFDPAGNGPPVFYEPFPVQGYYAAIGYNFGKSAMADCIPCWTKGFEPCFRFQRYDQTWVQDPARIEQTLRFATTQYTFGLNYFIKGHNCKVQANYDLVKDPRGDSFYRFHHVRNDFFSMNFQVMW